jgi:hypothetical protein
MTGDRLLAHRRPSTRRRRASRTRSGRAAARSSGPVSLSLPPEAIEQVAARATKLVVEDLAAPEDGWLRGAARIGAYIDAPASRVYALTACKPPRIPVHRDGSALIARRSELDAWMRSGGARRP